MTNKAEITFTGRQMSMNHKEIAELVGSRPDNVKVSIERLAERGAIKLPALQEIEEINNLGLPIIREYYRFSGEQGKRDSIIVVAQLCPEFTAQLVDRWQELEEEVLRLQGGTQQARQEISVNHDILSLARVVAEATASATMRAVIDIVGIQKPLPAEPVAAIAPPLQDSFEWLNSHKKSDKEPAEYVLVSNLVWTSGLSDAACRRLAVFANLSTRLTNGETGHLLVHRESFFSAAQALLDGSIPPTGKRKRWQHPEFGGFELRLKADHQEGGEQQ